MATIFGNASGNSLSGGNAADQIFGNGGNDTLSGGAGSDSLYGGSGNDLLDGGAGTDLLDGGAGLDTVDYSMLLTAILVDLAAGTASFPGQPWANEELFSIEGVLGGSGDDTVYGTAGADSVFGGDGNDSLLGREGSDTLIGGSGDDFLEGGTGADSLIGGNGNDTLWGGGANDTLNGGAGMDLAVYTDNVSPLLVDLRAGTTSFPGTPWASETLVSIEAVAAGGGDDTLIGTAGANDLHGGGGDDLLSGGNGEDFLFGEDGNDLVRGGGGNDTIAAGTTRFGTFYEEEMNDGVYEQMMSWLVDDGADTFDGGNGTDTLLVRGVSFAEYHNAPGGLFDAEVDLALGTLRLSLPGASTDTLVSIENVITGDGDDTIIGSSGANRIESGSGVNLVEAGGGNDTIIGGSFALYSDLGDDSYSDRLYGEGGDDFIRGNGAGLSDYWWGAGTDYLDGGSGNDTLVGGEGNTEMVGGAGADTFVFINAVGHYDYHELPMGATGSIQDFDPSSGDRIQISLFNPDFAGTPTFVGEVSALDDIGAFELGYVHVTDEQGSTDTLLRFSNVDREEEAYDGMYSLNVTLSGYAGDLGASDVLFV